MDTNGKMFSRLRNRLLYAGLLFGLPCFAVNVAQIQSIYEAILNAPSEHARPSQKDVASVVNETTIEQLSDSELKSILPVIGRCLNSARPSVVQEGLAFLLLTTAVRWNSASMLAPYVPNLEKFASDRNSDVGYEALHILLALTPKLPPEVISYLARRLDSEGDMSPEVAGSIVGSLLEDAGSDSSLVRKVLDFADAQPDVSVRNAALRALGRMRSHDRAALSFIGQKLRDSNPYVRKAAVDTVGRLEPKERGEFLAAVTEIAMNPLEPKENRSLADSILKQ